MTRMEAIQNSIIWQNIGEVAVQTSILALSGHLSAHLRPELRFPDGIAPASLK